MAGGDKIYIPKTVPFTQNNHNYNFTKIENWGSGVETIYFPTSRWADINNAPDRLVNFQSNTDFIMNVGYIVDRGIEQNRKNILTGTYGAFYLNNTRKLYPMAIDDNRTMEPGDNYSVLTFRTIKSREDYPTNRTNYASVTINSEVFIFADYHGPIIDNLSIQSKWIGKKIIVIDKTSNISLLNDDCVSGYISIKSEATANNYGYIVLKLTD